LRCPESRPRISIADPLQIDTLHPYGETDVCGAGSPLAFDVLVGIAKRETVERYNALFVEAGIAVGAFTFSAAAGTRPSG